MRRQRGFSLIELLVVLAILTIVMAVIFQQIISMQQRYRTEEKKVDMFSNGREFIDQFVRDMHMAGYPSFKVYSVQPLVNDERLAVGVVIARPAFLMIEGDVDGDGRVDSVAYTICNSAGNCATAAGGVPGGNCPCTIRRSQVVKMAMSPWQQPTSFSDSVEGVVNSTGMAGGGGPLVVLGISSVQVAGNFIAIADDTLFQSMKNMPVFQYFNTAGNAVAANTDISTPAGQTVIRQIRSVRIALNLVANAADPQTGMKPSVFLGAVAKMPNCSLYAEKNAAFNWNFTISGC